MSLFEELKRRNVVRVALLYAVTSWVILQVADVLFGLIDVPDGSLRLVFGILVLGFPVALVLSWIYDLTPEGIRRDSQLDRSGPRVAARSRKLNVVIVALLLVGVALVVLTRSLTVTGDGSDATGQPAAVTGEDGTRSGNRSTVRDTAPASIAVLPFANFSGNADDEYFSDGLADTVLHQLSQIPGLKVIARNSSFQFKGTNMDVREVGQRLGVANVLEGSVQRYGEKVRVIAQLISASDGSHVWSQSFDYEMEDIFALHDAIARAVADHMKISLLPGDDARIGLGGTDDPRAYDLLLQAEAAMIDIFNPAIADRVDPDVDFRPMQMVDGVLALDPDYVDAIIQKAEIYNLFAFQTTSVQRQSDFVDRARPLVDRALELAPDYSGAWSLKGSVAHRSGNSNEAVAAFRKAIELNPNDADAHLGLAVASIETAPLDTIEHMRIARQLDPQNPFNRPMVLALANLNRIDEAVATLESGLTGLSGIDQIVMDDLADIYYIAKGRPDESARWAGRLLALQPGSQRGIVNMARAWMAVGDPQRAGRWLATADASPGAFDFVNLEKVRLMALEGDLTGARNALDALERPAGPLAGVYLGYKARLCLLAKDLECARDAVRGMGNALDQAEARGLPLPDVRVLQQLWDAKIAAELGESPEAPAEAVLEATRDLPRTGYPAGADYTDVEAFVLLGQPEVAAGTLQETLLKDGGIIPFDSFTLPADRGLVLVELDGNPRFEEWKARFRERRQAMREKMVEMEDFAEIPAPPAGG